MSFSQNERFQFFGSNWQQMYNQLLMSYYQLAENYRAAVNKNISLTEELKEKSQNYRQVQKSIAQNSTKFQTKRTILEEPDILQETVKQSEKKQSQELSQKRKLKRKCKLNISNQYTCTYQDCNRSYDSSVSLNLHIKLKHNGGTKKERQTYAKMILDAQQNGLEPPKININFPPRFLQDFKTSYEYMKRYSM